VKSLADYTAGMKLDQEEIYYMTGESLESVSHSPHLEAFRARELEVLLLTDAVDELAVQAMGKVGDRELKSINRGIVRLGTEAEQNESRKALNEKQVEYLDLMTLLRTKLSSHVKEVRLTNRLTNSPACLVLSEEDMSPQLARIIRAQQGQAPETLHILELNPDHEIVRKLRERVAADPKDPLIDDYAELLYGGALIAQGSELANASQFTGALAKLMGGGI
jgi:molecular chaperone HtpG